MGLLQNVFEKEDPGRITGYKHEEALMITISDDQEGLFVSLI